jgi:integrase
MPVKLTDQAINKATREAETDGNRRELSDAGCRGLRIRITPTGARTWLLGARDRLGKARRFQLGSYPTMGISDARNAARAMHHKVKQEGVDPIAEKRHSLALGKAAMAGVGTLRALLDTYGDTEAAPKSWLAGRPRVELVFKRLLDLPVSTVTLPDLQRCVDGYVFPKSAAFVVRTFRPVLKWASRPGRAYVSADLRDIGAPAKIKARERVLNEDELHAVLPHLRDSASPHAQMMRFLLLTLARREEAATATWANVNLGAATWTITETKNGQPHVIPLSRQAVALLVGLGQGKPRDLVFSTRTGEKLGNWDRHTKAIQKASGTEGWTRHDLRRTGATMLGEMGELPDIIEAALNHTSIRSPLAATYNRSRYRPQVAVALQRLADALDGIEAEAAKVVLLRVGV